MTPQNLLQQYKDKTLTFVNLIGLFDQGDGTEGCPLTSANNYQSNLYKNPAERRPACFISLEAAAAAAPAFAVVMILQSFTSG
jgi:hypothetical protein